MKYNNEFKQLLKIFLTDFEMNNIALEMNRLIDPKIKPRNIREI